MPSPEIHVLVCLNERPEGATKPSCAPRGALAVYHRLKDTVKARGLKARVLVTRTGCLKHCSLGVVVAVHPGNRWYREVTVEDAAGILDAALGEGDGGAVGEPGEPGEPEQIPSDAVWE